MSKETEETRKFPVSIATERMQHCEQREWGWGKSSEQGKSWNFKIEGTPWLVFFNG